MLLSLCLWRAPPQPLRVGRLGVTLRARCLQVRVGPHEDPGRHHTASAGAFCESVILLLGFMVTAGTALEPNFNLDHYEVIGNVIKSGTLAIHCWRRSSNGRIEHNVRIENRPNHPVVRAHSPAA